MSQSLSALTTRPVIAGKDPDADFVTCANGVAQTTRDINAPAPGPIPAKTGHSFPAKERGGTTEHKYRSSCTSQDSCSRSKTGIKSVTLHQQHNRHQVQRDSRQHDKSYGSVDQQGLPGYIRLPREQLAAVTAMRSL